MTHTPGPWEAEWESNAGYDGMTDGWNIVQHGGEDIFPVVVVDEGDNDDKAITAANARLIAAAPDLLKALGELVQSIEDMGLDCDSEGGDEGIMWLDDARALLAKAKGEK